MLQNKSLELELKDDKGKKRFHPKLFLKGLQTKLFKSQYSYLAFCFIIPIAIMYCIYIAKGIYPFGETSPLVLDLQAQYVSFFEAMRDFFLGDRSAIYSFSRSLGGEFVGIIAYYAASPLNIITTFFPADRIMEAVLTILLVKCGLSGLTFGFYLHKKTKKPKKLVIFTFATMYALTAYAIVHQHNTMWIDAVIWLPLLAYGLENLVYRKKCFLYVVSLTVIMISNYYIGFMICIFSVLYFFFCYFSKSKEQINPFNEKFHFTRTGLRFSLFSLLAAAIAAFMLIAAIYSLKFGKTEFTSPNWNFTAKFEIMDFLAKFLPGSYDTVRPEGLPFVYCGLLTVLLVPIYFASKKISIREKVSALALVAVFLFSFIVKPLDLIWHGFANPNWLNYRYSFIFCFVLLVLAYKAFGNLKSVSEKAVVGIVGVLILFVVIVQKYEFKTFIKSDKKLLTFQCIWFSIAVAAVLAALLCIWIRLRKQNPKHRHTKAVSAVLAAVVCLELFGNGVVCVFYLNKDVTYTKYANYYNHVANYRPIVEATKEYDPSFYRMEKTYHRSKNDNMALNMYGLTSSTSTLNQKAIAFTNKMGYVGRSHITMYKGGTAVGDSLLGIKYLIDGSDRTTYDNLYAPIESLSNENYVLYENKTALSLAYGVDSKINEFDLEEHEFTFDRYNALLGAMLGNDEPIDLFKYVSADSITTTGGCSENIYIDKGTFTTKNSEGTVIFEYTAPKTGFYYFYTDGSANKDTPKISVTNYPASRYYMRSDYNHIIVCGYFERNEPIKISVTLPENCTFSVNSVKKNLAYFEIDEYHELFEEIRRVSPQFNISDDYTEDHLKGTISTAKGNQTILTTIPYDEGWNVYVDGKEVEIYETLDALMAFDITTAGEHTLEMKYMPDEYLVGAFISTIGIIIFAALVLLTVFYKKIFKKPLKAYPKVYFDLADFDDEEVIDSSAENQLPPCQNPDEGQPSSDLPDSSDSSTEEGEKEGEMDGEKDVEKDDETDGAQRETEPESPPTEELLYDDSDH